MDRLRGNMLSEMSEKDKYSMTAYVYPAKYNKLVNIPKKKKKERKNETNAYRKSNLVVTTGERHGGAISGEGCQTYKLLVIR